MSPKSTPDLTEFFRYSQPKRKPCQTAWVLDQLDTMERQQLEAALATDKGLITAPAIRQWLDARGHQLSDTSIGNHRRGACACGRA